MLLLDTHIWIWWINQSPQKLPPNLIRQIEEAEIVAISAVSCFEVMWLYTHNRISLNTSIHEWLLQAVHEAGITCIPMSCEIASLAAGLPEHHKDPHDRIIIASTIQKNFKLISADRKFLDYRELDDLLISV